MPSIGRRELLAGSAALAGGTVAGGALVPAAYLPDGVAIWRMRLRSVPSVDPEPPVDDGLVSAARDGLRSLVDRAENTWSRVEDQAAATEALPGLADPERAIQTARDYLADAESDPPVDALFAVRRGATFAGEAIGGARLALGEASGDHLAAQARDVLSAVAAERDRVRAAVADPSAGLARLYWVETWLRHARLNAYRDGTYAGQDEPTTEYTDRDVISTWGSHMAARRYRADAARLYDAYRAATAGERRDLTDHVARVDGRLLDEARERTYTRREAERRRAAVRDLPDGPYRAFRAFVDSYLRNADVHSPSGLSTGLPVYRAVGNAATVLRACAAAAVRADDRLRDADRVPVSALAAARGAGLSLLDDRLAAAAERPTLELLLRESRRLLWAGDVEFDRHGDVEHPRARAYAKYRLAVEYLRPVDEVAARVDRPDA